MNPGGYGGLFFTGFHGGFVWKNVLEIAIAHPTYFPREKRPYVSQKVVPQFVS